MFIYFMNRLEIYFIVEAVAVIIIEIQRVFVTLTLFFLLFVFCLILYVGCFETICTL